MVTKKSKDVIVLSVDSPTLSRMAIREASRRVIEQHGEERLPHVEVKQEDPVMYKDILAVLEANGVSCMPSPHPVKQPKKVRPQETQDRLIAQAEAKRARKRQSRLRK